MVQSAGSVAANTSLKFILLMSSKKFPEDLRDLFDDLHKVQERSRKLREKSQQQRDRAHHTIKAMNASLNLYRQKITNFKLERYPEDEYAPKNGGR